MSKNIAIPYDVYESETHLLCIIPMGGVDKSSVHIKLRDYALHIDATRNQPEMNDSFVNIQHECYR
jgi:HSP20 family molecular chaperone IbpA